VNFEALFNNPIIFIILVAVISSLFKKKKENSNDPNGQKKSSNPMENKRSQPNNPFDEIKDLFREMTGSLSDGTGTPKEKMRDLYSEERKVAQQKEVELNQQRSTDWEPEPLKSVGSHLLPINQEKSKDKEIELNETKLVDAVIWSEILGPPRAKKPYKYTRK
jgi:cell division protein FtsN